MCLNMNLDMGQCHVFKHV